MSVSWGRGGNPGLVRLKILAPDGEVFLLGFVYEKGEKPRVKPHVQKGAVHAFSKGGPPGKKGPAVLPRGKRPSGGNLGGEKHGKKGRPFLSKPREGGPFEGSPKGGSGGPKFVGGGTAGGRTRRSSFPKTPWGPTFSGPERAGNTLNIPPGLEFARASRDIGGQAGKSPQAGHGVTRAGLAPCYTQTGRRDKKGQWASASQFIAVGGKFTPPWGVFSTPKIWDRFLFPGKTRARPRKKKKGLISSFGFPLGGRSGGVDGRTCSGRGACGFS
ncbi:hypothetical protein CRENBAI_006886 [Crenichthys baileyi]|uniref:Uncharacterized protein n=1 Tax=Crenichthys baileyi TaxID=28760 RepID=A0AAV9RB76_9TELE